MNQCDREVRFGDVDLRRWRIRVDFLRGCGAIVR
jgi:hypothetical protein